MEKNLKTGLKFFRISDWRAYFLMALLGFLISKGFLFPLKDIIIFYFLVFLLLAFGFSINNCFDLREDKFKEDGVNPIVNNEISLKKSLFLAFLPGILALILASLFSIKIFLFSLTGLAIGFFYSAPPFRFKSRPLIDLISHGLFAGAFIFLLPVLIFSPKLTPFHFLIAFSIFYFSAIAEFRNHFEDYETDKKADLRTTVCVLGYKNSENLLRYLTFLSPLILFPNFLIYEKYSFLFLIFSLIFLFFVIFDKDSKMVKNCRIIDVYVVLSFGLIFIATI